MDKKNKKIDNNRYLITCLNPKSPISEQYRTIRTTIDFKMVDQGMKNFLVISAEAAAGKSTTIANLVITFAQQGKRVLLIDVDLRKPSVHMFFKIPNRSGLTNILTCQSTVEESLQGSPINENLAIITSGLIPPNPSELLSSAEMKNLIESMKQAFEIYTSSECGNGCANHHRLCWRYCGRCQSLSDEKRKTS